tara:strand:- start:438 stop:626 length:189 start_codon:yes stop_codon:yes gene_type:complete
MNQQIIIPTCYEINEKTGRRIYDVEQMREDFEEAVDKCIRDESFRVGGKMQQQVSKMFDEEK